MLFMPREPRTSFQHDELGTVGCVPDDTEKNEICPPEATIISIQVTACLKMRFGCDTELKRGFVLVAESVRIQMIFFNLQEVTSQG